MQVDLTWEQDREFVVDGFATSGVTTGSEVAQVIPLSYHVKRDMKVGGLRTGDIVEVHVKGVLVQGQVGEMFVAVQAPPFDSNANIVFEVKTVQRYTLQQLLSPMHMWRARVPFMSDDRPMLFCPEMVRKRLRRSYFEQALRWMISWYANL